MVSNSLVAIVYKLPDAVEDEIEALVHEIENNDNLYRPTDDKIGNVVYRHDLLDEYVSFVTKTTDIELEGMKIVLDCANGAAYEAMPKFYVV